MKFSVIIPTYNRVDLVIETIKSVLNQTFKDFELIIVNDGSTDNTIDALKQFNGKLRLITQPNGGLEKAYNQGVEISEGEYLAFLDSDDLYFPFTLEYYYKIITANDNPGLVVGQPIFFTDVNKIAKNQNIDSIKFVSYKDYLSKDRSVFTSCSMIIVRRDIYNSIGGFRKDNDYKYFHEDFYFFLKFGMVSPAIIIFEPKLFAYRIHSSNSVKNIDHLLKSIAVLISDERKGIFPGGDRRKKDRYSILAGTLLFWVKRALKQRYFKKPITLLLGNIDLIIIGVLWKIKTKSGTVALREIEIND
jgi:glycosyltransferase involved in cell wall biosynthesis